MGKNAFLNDLLFELQKMTTTKIIKGGDPKDEEEDIDVAIAIDVAEDVTPTTVSGPVPVGTTSGLTTGSASISSHLTSQLTSNISDVKTMAENLSKTLQKYLKDLSNMTLEDLQAQGFSQQQIAAIKKLKEKYKPIEKEVLEGDIILGKEGENGAIVLNRETHNYLGSSMLLATPKKNTSDNISNTDIDIR